LMACPVEYWVTPYSVSPLRMSGIQRPEELSKVTLRPFATTTPESLLAVPRRVEVSLYVASSLISSLRSPYT
jgi:hypothetical protein